jgi:predicted O-methyltransferase YrrM
MVQAATARLAHGGAWTRLRTGAPIEDRTDLVGLDLLVAAGVLARDSAGRYEVLDDVLDIVADDPEAIANNAIAYLRRALRHAEGGPHGWIDDPAVMRAQGRGSAVVADVMREHLLPLMDSSRSALEAGSGRFLDVGTGVAAIAARLCTLYPGTTATGIDVSDVVLDIAREELEASGLADRVELRRQPVEELADRDRYDLAWVPQPFIAPEAFAEGVRRIFDALRADRWIVAPIASGPDDAGPFDRALFAHSAHLMGGGPLSVTDAARLLEGAGFTDVEPWFFGSQAVMRGRRP